MVNLPTDGARSFVLRPFPAVKSRKILLSALLVLNTFSPALALTEITPFVSVGVSAVDNEFATTSESGKITTLAPGVSVSREGTKASLQLDYQYRAIASHGLEQEDREVHELGLASRYEHSPGFWVSTLNASSRLTDLDIDGIQSADDDFINDNTTELRTVAIDTSVSDFITGKIEYLARVGADYTDLEDGGDSEGYGVLLDLNTFRSPDRFTWRASLDSKESRSDEREERIDRYNAILNYRVSDAWSVFFDGTAYKTDSSELDEKSRLLGVSWRPTERTLLSLGAGERGDEKTYSLDASHRHRRVSVLASYQEEITTAREDALDSQLAGFLAQISTLSISVEPLLQKRFTLSLSVSGLYSEVVVAVYDVDRSGGQTIEDETVQGYSATFLRRLNARNTFSVNVGYQETASIEESELSSLSLNFSRQHSINETFNFMLGWSEQESSLQTNEYERKSLGATYRVSF